MAAEVGTLLSVRMSFTSDVMLELACTGERPGAAGLTGGVGQDLADHDAAPDLEGARRQGKHERGEHGELDGRDRPTDPARGGARRESGSMESLPRRRPGPQGYGAASLPTQRVFSGDRYRRGTGSLGTQLTEAETGMDTVTLISSPALADEALAEASLTCTVTVSPLMPWPFRTAIDGVVHVGGGLALDDGHAAALAGGVGHQVLDHEAATHLDEAEEEDEKDGGHHGELHGRRRARRSRAEVVGRVRPQSLPVRRRGIGNEYHSI